MGYSRSDVQATKNRMKKFVRYKEGVRCTVCVRVKFERMAKDAKATYKLDKLVLVNTNYLKSIIKIDKSFKLYQMIVA